MPLLLPPPSTSSGTLRFRWIDPGGVVRDLTYASSPHVFVSKGATGLGAPPVQIADEKLPWAGGSVLRQVGTQPVRMLVPITVAYDTMANLVQAVDTLEGWFDTGSEARRTPGYLQVIREDDSVRQRLCYYEGGLDGDLQTGNPTTATYAVHLYAPDPWATDEADQVDVWPVATTYTTAIINGGQLDAYPVWEITGPAQGIVISNSTTGKVWGWGGTLTAGQTLLVDTRPSSQRFTYPVTVGPSGISSYSFMTANSELWWLQPGLNGIAIAIVALGTGATSVRLEYRQRFRGMLR